MLTTGYLQLLLRRCDLLAEGLTLWPASRHTADSVACLTSTQLGLTHGLQASLRLRRDPDATPTRPRRDPDATPTRPRRDDMLTYGHRHSQTLSFWALAHGRLK